MYIFVDLSNLQFVDILNINVKPSQHTCIDSWASSWAKSNSNERSLN
jgi:hypothetical protein